MIPLHVWGNAFHSAIHHDFKRADHGIEVFIASHYMEGQLVHFCYERLLGSKVGNIHVTAKQFGLLRHIIVEPAYAYKLSKSLRVQTQDDSPRPPELEVQLRLVPNDIIIEVAPTVEEFKLFEPYLQSDADHILTRIMLEFS